jgi:hypothetical protein
MDHYIPKRRIPVTLWSSDLPGVAGSIFIDLDAAGNQHQTLLEKLNESARFLPVAVGPEDGSTSSASVGSRASPPDGSWFRAMSSPAASGRGATRRDHAVRRNAAGGSHLDAARARQPADLVT